jgi:hypothetical protein
VGELHLKLPQPAAGLLAARDVGRHQRRRAPGEERAAHDDEVGERTDERKREDDPVPVPTRPDAGAVDQGGNRENRGHGAEQTASQERCDESAHGDLLPVRMYDALCPL